MRVVSAILFYVCILFCYDARAFLFSPGDTLQMAIAGSATWERQSPFNIRFEKQIGLHFSTEQNVSNNTTVQLSVDRNKMAGIPFIQQGYIRYHSANTSITTGVLTQRIGECGLYNSSTVTRHLFDKMVLWDIFDNCKVLKSNEVYTPSYFDWVLWDATGIGATLEKSYFSHRLTGSYIHNPKQYTACAAIYQYGKDQNHGLFLGGIQTPGNKNNNDHLVCGSELLLCRKQISLHTMIKYDKQLKFNKPEGEPENNTSILAGLLESKTSLTPFLDIRFLTYYKKNSLTLNNLKKVQSEEWGIITEVMVCWVGIGYGRETCYFGNSETTFPELYLLLKPFKNLACIKCSFNTRKEDGHTTQGKWACSLWIEL